VQQRRKTPAMYLIMYSSCVSSSLNCTRHASPPRHASPGSTFSWLLQGKITEMRPNAFSEHGGRYRSNVNVESRCVVPMTQDDDAFASKSTEGQRQQLARRAQVSWLLVARPAPVSHQTRRLPHLAPPLFRSQRYPAICPLLVMHSLVALHSLA